MKKIITFSYEGVDVPIEIRDRYWMVNLANIIVAFEKDLDYIILDKKIQAQFTSLASTTDHELMDCRTAGPQDQEELWFHYFIATYFAAHLDPHFDFWLLKVYNEILGIHPNLFDRADEAEKHILCMMTDQLDTGKEPLVVNPCLVNGVNKDILSGLTESEADKNLMDIPPLYSTNEVAQFYRTNPINLILTMHKCGVIERRNYRWAITEEYQNHGFFQSVVIKDEEDNLPF